MVIAVALLDPTPLFSAEGRADIFMHILVLHGLAQGMRYSILGVWWTLSVECLYYLSMTLLRPSLRQGLGAPWPSR
jgi:hypothetical protein